MARLALPVRSSALSTWTGRAFLESRIRLRIGHAVENAFGIVPIKSACVPQTESVRDSSRSNAVHGNHLAVCWRQADLPDHLYRFSPAALED